MIKTIIKAGILGGLIAYMWGVISWVVLPWHTVTLGKFSDQELVTNIVRDNVPESGIYILPNAHKNEPGLSKEKLEHLMKQDIEKMKEGPFVFASIILEGADPESPIPYLSNLLLQIVMAMLITWLLLQTTGLSYRQRVLFVVMVGAIAGTQGHLVNWMWWRFSAEYTLVNMADLLISWTLAGLLIARFTGSTGTPDTEE